MDDIFKGMTVGSMATVAISWANSDKDGFREYAHERLCEFISEHDRDEMTRDILQRKAKDLEVEYITVGGKGLQMIEGIARDASEENDLAYEHIRAQLIETLEENDYSDIPEHKWRSWAKNSASDFFSQH